MNHTLTHWYRKVQLEKIARKKSVVIDFDGTIADNSKFEYPEIGPPFKGVQEALQKIQDKGYKVRIYTCRLNEKQWKKGKKQYQEMKKTVEAYLKENEIPYDDIVEWHEGKPFAEWYIDDKSIEFKGSWKNILNQLK